MTSEQIEQAAIQAAANKLREYLLPDALKPEYDGMTSYELAKLATKAYKDKEMELIGEDMMRQEIGEQVAEEEVRP